MQPRTAIITNTKTIACMYSAPSPKYMGHYLVNSSHHSQGSVGKGCCSVSGAGVSPREHREERSRPGKQVCKSLIKISASCSSSQLNYTVSSSTNITSLSSHLSALGKTLGWTSRRIRQAQPHRDKPCSQTTNTEHGGPHGRLFPGGKTRKIRLFFFKEPEFRPVETLGQ